MANRRLRKELLETVRGLHGAGAIDVKKMQEFETFRVELAPAPYVPPSVPRPPNCVLSVVLEAGERVEWTWRTDPNGARYVTGYTISRPRRARGVRKKGQLVGQVALRHDSVAPEQLPAGMIAHSKLVVTRKSGEAILKQARPRPAAMFLAMRAIREASKGG